jgi:hypothetical protein
MPTIHDNSIYGQPPQALPSEEKDEIWGRGNMDWIEQYAQTELPKKANRIRKNYNITNGIIDVEDYITEEDNDYSEIYDAVEQSMKESLFNLDEVDRTEDLKFFPIVPSIIELLVGEIMKKADTLKIAAVDSTSVNEYWDFKKQKIIEYFQQKAQQKVAQAMQEQGVDMESEEGQQQFQQGLQQELSLPGIQKFMNRNYKNNWEEWANRIQEQSYHKYKLWEKKRDLLKHQLAVDEAYIHIIIEEDDLDVETWNPAEVVCVKSPHVKYTNKSSMIARQYYTTIEQVISRYKNKIHHTVLEKYNSPGGINPGLVDDRQSPDDIYSNMYQEKKLIFFRNATKNQNLALTSRVMVTEGYWVTQRRMVNLKAIYDGVYVEKILDDNFEQTIDPVYDEDKNLIAGEEVEYFYTPQIYGGTKLNFSLGSVPGEVFDEDKHLKDSIHNQKTSNQKRKNKTGKKLPTIEEDIKKGELYVDIAPIAYQFTDSLNPWKPLIPVVGCYGFNPNMNIGKPYSFVDKTKAYQVLFNGAMNQIDNFMKTEIGLFHLIDWKLIPRDSLNGTQKGDPVDWILSASATGVGGVDSSPTNTGGGNVFQQPTVVNLLKNPQFQSRLELAAAFKSLLFESVGITPQRMGSVQERETATGVTQAVNNSYAQTDHIVSDHIDLMREFKEMLLDAEKFIESKKPVSRVQFFNSDEENVMIEMDTEGLLLRRFQLYVTSKPDSARILEQMRQWAMQDNTSGATTMDKLVMIESDNIRTIKDTLQASIDRLEQQQQQAQQAEQQKLETQIQAAAEQDAKDKAFEAEENEKERRKDMYIAEVKAVGFAKDNDIDDSGFNDALEVAKFNQASEKNYSDIINRENEASAKRRTEDRKNNLEQRKLLDKQNDRITKERIEDKKIRRDYDNMKNDEKIEKLRIKNSQAKKN